VHPHNWDVRLGVSQDVCVIQSFQVRSSVIFARRPSNLQASEREFLPMNLFRSSHVASIFCPLFTVFCSVVLFVWGIALPHAAWAQNAPEMTATYGRGVHAYFANQTLRAEQYFSQVIQLGSTDPRVYYFRAMARMRLGRRAEAEQDMRSGAALESRDPGNQHAISMALERIQGRGRRVLEQFRRQARLDRERQWRQQSLQRYEQLKQREPAVLRQETPVQLEQLLEPSTELLAPKNNPSAPQQTPAPDANLNKPAPLESSPAPAADTGPIPKSPPAPAKNSSAGGDDLFGEPSTSPPADDNSSGPPSLPVDSDEKDPFTFSEPESPAAEPTANATAENLAASDKLESGKLLGVLGRVVSSTVPWRTIQLPALNHPQKMLGAAEALSAEEFALGPPEEGRPKSDSSAVGQNALDAKAAGKPAAMAEQDDPFAAADDPFATAEEKPAPAPDKAAESSDASQSTESLEEDPFR